MSKPEPWLEENYEEIRAARGWDYATLAANVATSDPSLAAYFRAKSAGETPSESAAPKGRRTKKAQTVAPSTDKADAGDADKPDGADKQDSGDADKADAGDADKPEV